MSLWDTQRRMASSAQAVDFFAKSIHVATGFNLEGGLLGTVKVDRGTVRSVKESAFTEESPNRHHTMPIALPGVSSVQRC